MGSCPAALGMRCQRPGTQAAAAAGRRGQLGARCGGLELVDVQGSVEQGLLHLGNLGHQLGSAELLRPVHALVEQGLGGFGQLQAPPVQEVDDDLRPGCRGDDFALVDGVALGQELDGAVHSADFYRALDFYDASDDL